MRKVTMVDPVEELASTSDGQEPAPREVEAGTLPLAVDLDGTLIRTDSLIESMALQAKAAPLTLLALPLHLRHGRAGLKHALAVDVQPDVATLPYREPLVAWLRGQHAAGRRLVLATGADEAFAQRVAAHLDLFDQVMASDGRRNLTGASKRERLVAAFGEGGFDYAGDSLRDLAIWRAARRAVVVGNSAGPLAAAAAAQGTPVEKAFRETGMRWPVLLEAMRWPHWVKNLLVFLPLVVLRAEGGADTLLSASLACAAFCLLASSVYLFNDLMDLPDDRAHPLKRRRPLASGRLTPGSVVLLLPLLWLATVALAWPLPPPCGAALAAYLALMVAYSMGWRDRRYLDAAVLGAGYALRLLAGAGAIGRPLPLALAGWSLLMFFGLALVKRRAELAVAMQGTAGDRARSRAWRAADARPMELAGGAACTLALAALVAWPLSLESRGPSSMAIGSIGLLLAAWTAHMWRAARRGLIRDDPVRHALSDPLSQLAALLIVALLWLPA